MRARPSPDAPHLGKRRPPRAPSCRPHSAQSQLARARAVGLVTGPRARTTRTRSQWVVGPAARPKGRVVGGGRAPDPGRPTPRQEAPPPGALVPPPQCAKPARKSARCGVGDGSPRPHHPHPQPVGSRPRPHARKDEWSGVEERPTPDALHPGKRLPQRAPTSRPHSAQSQLARARAVGFVTGPHAHNPRIHSQWVAGPGRTPKRKRGRRWESAGPRTLHTLARGAPPPGTHVPAPQRAKPARKGARGGVGDGSPRPHPPHPQPVGSRPRPHARKDEWSGLGERPTPDAPHPGKRRPPPGTLMPPPQRAKPARKSARCGAGGGSPRPYPPNPQPVGSGPRPHARKDKWSGLGERRTLDAPHPGKRRPPRAPSCRPHNAQSQLARARAVGLVAGPHARIPRTHSQWVVGPGRTPERTSGRGWESARPRTPHTHARGAPPGRPHAAPTARKASSQERALWGW